MSATTAAEYAAAAAELLERNGVATTRMFGSDALSSGGKTFALLVNGRVVVKLPATRVSELVAPGAGQRFDPGPGRLMKEWIGLDEDTDVRAHLFAAMEYVGTRQESRPGAQYSTDAS